MSFPFVKSTDTPRDRLRRAFEEARGLASERYAEFDGFRRKTVESGVDVSRDEKAFAELEKRHQAYEQAAERAERARDAYEAAVLGELGLAGGGESAAFGRVDGIADAFFKTLGRGPELKALVSGASPVPPFFDERIRVLPQRILFVRSLIPVRPADGDLVQYTRHTVFTNQAAPVAAGAEKPKSTNTIERVQETIRTIAHVSEAIDRAILDDLPGLADFLDSTLRLGVLLAEENQVLNGDGNAPNLEGLLNTSGIGAVTQTTESKAEAIHKGITTVRLALHEPDGVVLHPNDWQDVRLEKTNDGELIAAPVVDEDPPRLWGKTVITSPVIAEGTALVGAFGVGATIWDREQARVDFAETGLGDQAGEELFTRNLVRLRAEERIAFGVERPAAFAEVTFA